MPRALATGVAVVLAAQLAVGAPLRPRVAPGAPPVERLALLDHQLDLAHHDAQAWYFGWSLTSSAIAIAQLVSFPTEPGLRPPWIVWSASTTLFAALSWILRPAALTTRNEVLQSRHAEGRTVDERLRETERFWLELRHDEAVERAWWQQLICVGSNAIPFLVVGLGWRDWNWSYSCSG